MILNQEGSGVATGLWQGTGCCISRVLSAMHAVFDESDEFEVLEWF